MTYRITYRIANDNTEYKDKIEIRCCRPFQDVIHAIARKHNVAGCRVIPIKVSLVEKKEKKIEKRG